MSIENDDDTGGDPKLAALLPRVVLRAPFLSKELGPLRYVATNAEGVTVAMFDNGFALHLHGDLRSLVLALRHASTPALG